MNLFIPGRICLSGEHSDWVGIRNPDGRACVVGQSAARRLLEVHRRGRVPSPDKVTRGQLGDNGAAAPVLHRVLNYAPLQPHIWGGKGIGSQGDGSAQFLARSQTDQQASVEIIAHILKMSCLTLTLKQN